MQFDATGASLTDLFRSLNVNDPGTKEALVKLAEKVSRLEHEAEYQQMLFGEDPPRPVPRTRRGTPNPFGLHIVHGLVLPLAWAGATLLRHPAARRVLAGAVIATVGTAGALTPDLMQPAPASQLPLHGAAHHREVHRHHPVPGISPVPVVSLRRKHRRASAAGTASPSPSPTAAPEPSPTDPEPSPLPSITVPPVPGPAPTCTRLTGNHCHTGDDVVVVTERALTGLLGPP